ncbi:hypothetical protein GOB44_08845 [Sinorhizobium meliloti]|nr:hypothetical protein [Sinorhizobium meliloti]MDW9746843.1 hypothetical protein [Sinorhizobium meliloti]
MTDRPAIKPLEWRRNAAGSWFANTAIGTYLVNKGRWWVKGSTPLVDCGDDESAKMAAFEHFASRIRSCLLDKPEAVEGEPVAWRVKMSSRSDDYWHYFTKEPRYREEGEIWEPLFRHHASQVSAGEAGEPFLQTYDAGLLGEGGGGDVSWWHDYIRAELERAHEFYADQFSALAHTPADTDAAQMQEVALARATAREDLFPAMSSRIKAEREQARRKAFEEAAKLVEAQWNHCWPSDIAAAIRQRAEEPTNE